MYASKGRRIGSVPNRNRHSLPAIDFSATLAASVRRSLFNSASALPLRPTVEDWHQPRFAQRPRRLVLFAIDTSDSMGEEGPGARMEVALGAAVALARRAYLNRDQVALLTFRGRLATLNVPPTGSVQLVRDRLRQLAVGGATPLADGLRLARDTFRQAIRKDPAMEAVLLLISDGMATAPLRHGGDPAGDAIAVAKDLRKDGVASILIDTGDAPATGRLLPRLADALGGHCRRLQELTANDILQLLETPGPRWNHP